MEIDSLKLERFLAGHAMENRTDTPLEITPELVAEIAQMERLFEGNRLLRRSIQIKVHHLAELLRLDDQRRRESFDVLQAFLMGVYADGLNGGMHCRPSVWARARQRLLEMFSRRVSL